MRQMLVHPIRFMRDHRLVASQASAYLDRELDEPARRRVERHARVCPLCHHLIETLRGTIAGLAGLRAETGVEIADMVIARLRDA